MKFIIAYLDSIAPLIPVYIFLQKKNLPVLMNYFPLFVYFVSLYTFHTAANILSFDSSPNYVVFHVGLPIIFFSLLMFLKKLGSIFFFTKAMFIGGLVLNFLVILNSFFYETPETFNSISYAACSFYIMIVCLTYYLKRIKSDIAGDILKEPAFWFISGFFIYYSSSFAIFCAYRHFIREDNQYAGLAWQFHNVMLLIMCLVIPKALNLKTYV